MCRAENAKSPVGNPRGKFTQLVWQQTKEQNHNRRYAPSANLKMKTTNHQISLVMSDLGSRKKTMTPAALGQRRNAARKRGKIEIIIESGIAIPKARPQKGIWKNTSLSMNYGDSVLLPHKESQCLKQAIRAHGDGAIARAEDGQFRVWKVKKSTR
jgi:hypothetical protein